MHIEHRFISVRNLQSNGKAKVTNWTILQGLKFRINQAKAFWVDELDSVLWLYQTTSRVSIGEISFKLTFREEAVIPLKIGFSIE